MASQFIQIPLLHAHSPAFRNGPFTLIALRKNSPPNPSTPFHLKSKPAWPPLRPLPYASDRAPKRLVGTVVNMYGLLSGSEHRLWQIGSDSRKTATE
eukprot:2420871-Rhodomonas_salina.2